MSSIKRRISRSIPSRRRLPWLALALVLLSASPLRAAGSAIGVLRFGGPDGQNLSWLVAQQLKRRGVNVVGGDEIAQIGWALGVVPEKLDGLRAIAGKLALSGVISGKVTTQPVTSLSLLVRDGTGAEVAQATILSGRSGPTLAMAVEQVSWHSLAPALLRLRRREAAARPAPVAAPDPDAADVEPAPPAGPAPRPVPVATAVPGWSVEVTAALRASFRDMVYQSGAEDMLRGGKASLPFGTPQPQPGLLLGARWVPQQRFLRLGLGVHWEVGAGSTALGQPTNTRFGEFLATALVGLRWSVLSADLSLGGGSHWFSPKADPSALGESLFPEVAYQHLRFGVDLRLQARENFGVFAGLFYRHLLDLGPIAQRQWYPGAHVFGFETTIGGAYRLSRSWQLLLWLDLRLYDYQMDPLLGGPFVASSALDRHVGLGIGLVRSWGWDRSR